MKIDDVKVQVMKMEALSDGLKQGAQILAQWVINEIAKEEAALASQNDKKE